MEKSRVISKIDTLTEWYAGMVVVTECNCDIQSRVSKILNSLLSFLCMIDNVLVHDTTQQEHDQRLMAVLKHLNKPIVM